MRVLVLGVGRITAAVIEELDRYLSHGSEIRVSTRSAEGARGIAGIGSRLKNIDLKAVEQPAISMAEMRSMIDDSVDAVLVFPDGPTAPPEESDLRSVHLLLQVRSILRERSLRCRVITEILDDRNLELADVAEPDDTIVSDRLVSLYCLQLAEQPRLEHVFDELLDAEGADLSLHPVERYLTIGEPTIFRTAIAAASRAGATAIGYRRARDAKSREAGFGIEFNPPKNRPFVPERGDSLIVVAEH